jgi:hypothetical protein
VKFSAAADPHLSPFGARVLNSPTQSTACTLRGALAVGCLLAAGTAWGQRVQFPTMVQQGAGASAPAAGATTSPGWTAPATSAPAASAPATAAPTWATPAPAAATPPAFDPYAPPMAAPAAPAPYSPYAPSPYAPAPYTTTPGALYPEGIEAPQILPPDSFVGQPLKFLQEARLRWTWLAPIGSNSLGINDVDTSASFAVPFFKTTSPLVITPGFSLHFFDGPTEPPAETDLPPRTYDAFLDTAWYPTISPWFSAQVGVRIGAYTDFSTFSNQSIRVMGRGLGVVSLTPKLQIAAGVVYIDRLLIKLFPAGGIVWTPNPDARYEFLFPNPKLARRIMTLGTTDVWLYGFGEYGGGSWTFQHDDGQNDQFDYNDIRFGAGLESFGYRGLHGLFEVAYVFNRQVLYRSGDPNFYPSDTVMLRAGLSY